MRISVNRPITLIGESRVYNISSVLSALMGERVDLRSQKSVNSMGTGGI